MRDIMRIMPEEKNQRDRYGPDKEKAGAFEGGRLPEERREAERPTERPREFPSSEIPEETQVSTSPVYQVSEEAAQESKKIKNLPEDRQIQALIDLAFHKGLRHSIDTARALNNPYILDKFHDLLVDHLYKELVNRGELKEL